MEKPRYFQSFIQELAAEKNSDIIANMICAHDKDNYISKEFKINSSVKKFFKNFVPALKAFLQSVESATLPTPKANMFRIPSFFIIKDGKVVNEYHNAHMGSRPDYLRILIHPERENLIFDTFPTSKDQIHPSVYYNPDLRKKNDNYLLSVALQDKSKTKIRTLGSPGSVQSQRPDLILQKADMQMTTVVNNDMYFKFFLLFCAQRNATESALFFKDVIKYKNEQDLLQRGVIGRTIIDNYISPQSMLHLKITESEAVSVLETFTAQGPLYELFDGFATSVLENLLVHLFMAFKESDEFFDMIDTSIRIN